MEFSAYLVGPDGTRLNGPVSATPSDVPGEFYMRYSLGLPWDAPSATVTMQIVDQDDTLIWESQQFSMRGQDTITASASPHCPTCGKAR